MNRLIIICEGQTEKEFCEKTLYPYFQKNDIYIHAPLIKKSNGGIVRWSNLKKQIENHLKQDSEARVSLLIDYYGLNDEHCFPGWEESKNIPDINKKVNHIESKMLEDVDDSFKYRFIPYIQLHEGLLFNDIHFFYQLFAPEEIIGKDELEETFRSFSNPEMINNNKETAPSKRLERIIEGYSKVIFGNILAESIGLENIKAKSPRFNNWITQLNDIKE